MFKFLAGLVTVLAGATMAMAQSSSPALPFDNPAYSDPTKSWDNEAEFAKALREERCRAAIEKLREEQGLEKLEKLPDTGSEPLLIKAVDLRIDDCSVLVMNADTKDIRPVPTPEKDVTLRKLPE